MSSWLSAIAGKSRLGTITSMQTSTCRICRTPQQHAATSPITRATSEPLGDRTDVSRLSAGSRGISIIYSIHAELCQEHTQGGGGLRGRAASGHLSYPERDYTLNSRSE